MGGFADETAIVYWHRFVELAARELGKLCDFWIPVDRPMAYALQSRLLGKIPPGQKRMDKFNEMLVAIHRAHGDAATILRKRLPPKARIGFNLDVVPAFPQDPGSEADRMAADFIDNYLHRVPLALIKDGSANIPGKGVVEVPTCQKAADFIALDYFNRLLVSKEPAPEAGCLQDLCALSGMPGLRPMGPEDPPTEAGYGAAPDALYDAIKIVHSAGFDLPIHITASGVPTSDEDLRVRYTTAALAKVAHAIKQGIDVRSYFHYRDVDAYEFGLGFKSHFGLHGFDPHSFERSPRPLAALFKKIIATQKLPLQTG
jgi:beta-glucosidase/6-phospho-beta-glucosidase/beta-galactosidase